MLLAFVLGGCAPEGGGGPPGGGAMPVIAVQAETEPVEESIELVGSMAANERVVVQSEIGGFIEEVAFEDGDTVEKEQLLVRLETRKLEARLQEARADLDLARLNLERARALRENETIPQRDLDEARTNFEVAQAEVRLRTEELEDASIRAPFAGRVGQRLVSPGQYVASGEAITTLVDDDPLKIDFTVPERFISELARGKQVNILTEAYPQETFSGEIYFIAPEVDRRTRNLLTRARIDNPDGRLKPGMFGNLRLVLRIKDEAVVIPETALISRAETKLVNVVTQDDTVEFRKVEIGNWLKGKVEIVSGLSAGERVITEGHQKVGPGSKVTVRPPSAGYPDSSRQVARKNAEDAEDAEPAPETQDAEAS